jgi:hypothetical protein
VTLFAVLSGEIAHLAEVAADDLIELRGGALTETAETAQSSRTGCTFTAPLQAGCVPVPCPISRLTTRQRGSSLGRPRRPHCRICQRAPRARRPTTVMVATTAPTAEMSSANFWVVAGTAAPVIALAAAVVLGEAIQSIRGAGALGPGRLGVSTRIWVLSGCVMCCATVAMQAIVLAYALNSLATTRNAASTTLTMVLLLLGLFLVFFSTGISVVVRLVVERHRRQAQRADASDAAGVHTDQVPDGAESRGEPAG